MEYTKASVEAYEAAYRENFDEVARFAQTRGAVNDGEDVAQEAMLRMWNRCDQITYQTVTPWLYTVAGRIVIDNFRLKQNKLEFPSENMERNEEQEPAAANVVHASMLVAQALDYMHPDQREVVRLIHLEGYTYKEVAERLAIPPGTVKSRCFYGLAAARAAFHAEGVGVEIIAD